MHIPLLPHRAVENRHAFRHIVGNRVLETDILGAEMLEFQREFTPQSVDQ